MTIRKIETPTAREYYITAVPDPSLPVREQAEGVYDAIRDALRDGGASVFQERVFATAGAFPVMDAVRARSWRDSDDGVPPTRLVGAQWPRGEIAGVQVHAVSGLGRPEVLRVAGKACGRLFRWGGQTHIALSGLTGDGTKPEQARAMLEQAVAALRLAGTDLFSVARTWMWLGDILDWYADFNRVRTQFFTEEGLFSPTKPPRFPASTGIGIKPAGAAGCAMELVAVSGAADAIALLLKGGDQESAFNYGSAFSRAASVLTPAGRTIYVSGTAAVAPDGSTQHVGNATAQIDDTMAHFGAILSQMGGREQGIVQAMVYCKTDEVARHFTARYGDLPYPRVLVICDICRPELLFEIEGMACIGG